MKGEVFSGVALRMTADDDVATAIDDLEAGHVVEGDDGPIELAEAVPFGHKFALHPIDAGEEVIKYGYTIARATEDIAPGDWVHTHNTESTRGRGDLGAASGGEPA